MLVERYGTRADGNLHFTVFNPTNDKASYTLRLEAEPLRLSAAPTAEDLVSGRTGEVQRDGAMWALSGDLAPEDVALWSVRP